MYLCLRHRTRNQPISPRPLHVAEAAAQWQWNRGNFWWYAPSSLQSRNLTRYFISFHFTSNPNPIPQKVNILLPQTLPSSPPPLPRIHHVGMRPHNPRAGTGTGTGIQQPARRTPDQYHGSPTRPARPSIRVSSIAAYELRR